MMKATASVPCAGCTACCRGGEFVMLFEEAGDNPADYDHVEIKGPGGMDIKVLRHRPNGDCVYLGESGCTIYQRRPMVCARFDCRKYFLSMPREERRVIDRKVPQKRELFAAARARLKSLTPQERQDAVNRRRDPRTDVRMRQHLRAMLVMK